MDPSLAWPIFQIVIGLIALVFGGEFLVRGASLLAIAARISPLIIGLTVVAFGTSAPELGVSLRAAWKGAADVAVGNVVGSNIFNVLFILGLASLAAPLIVAPALLRRELPIMITASFMFWFAAMDGDVSRMEGLILFTALLMYILMCIRINSSANKSASPPQMDDLPEMTGLNSQFWFQIVLIVGGLLLLGYGSSWLVDGAVKIAKAWGVSELVIGLTIVAAGTSLPEVVTSVVASIRGERDIAVGNIVGSNLFNILCVIGLSAAISPLGIAVSPNAIRFDMPIMLAVAAICVPIFYTGRIISRFEGGLLLLYFVLYTVVLILKETDSPALEPSLFYIVRIVLPTTFLILAISVIRTWRAKTALSTGD